MTEHLSQLSADIDYARKCINQVSQEVRAAHKGESVALTIEEAKSEEGMLLASALYGLGKDIETAKNSLLLIKVFRNPEMREVYKRENFQEVIDNLKKQHEENN